MTDRSAPECTSAVRDMWRSAITRATEFTSWRQTSAGCATAERGGGDIQSGEDSPARRGREGYESNSGQGSPSADVSSVVFLRFFFFFIFFFSWGRLRDRVLHHGIMVTYRKVQQLAWSISWTNTPATHTHTESRHSVTVCTG